MVFFCYFAVLFIHLHRFLRVMARWQGLHKQKKKKIIKCFCMWKKYYHYNLGCLKIVMQLVVSILLSLLGENVCWIIRTVGPDPLFLMKNFHTKESFLSIKCRCTPLGSFKYFHNFSCHLFKLIVRSVLHHKKDGNRLFSRSSGDMVRRMGLKCTKEILG